MPRAFRSFLAITAGFITTAVLSLGMDTVLQIGFPRAFGPAGNTRDPAMLLTVLCYVVFFAAVGSYVAARLATHCPLRHAIALGVLALLLSLIPTLMFWSDTPAWYHFGVLVMILPAAWLGGTLRERQISPA